MNLMKSFERIWYGVTVWDIGVEAKLDANGINENKMRKTLCLFGEMYPRVCVCVCE